MAKNNKNIRIILRRLQYYASSPVCNTVDEYHYNYPCLHLDIVHHHLSAGKPVTSRHQNNSKIHFIQNCALKLETCICLVMHFGVRCKSYLAEDNIHIHAFVLMLEEFIHRIFFFFSNSKTGRFFLTEPLGKTIEKTLTRRK